MVKFKLIRGPDLILKILFTLFSPQISTFLSSLVHYLLPTIAFDSIASRDHYDCAVDVFTDAIHRNELI